MLPLAEGPVLEALHEVGIGPVEDTECYYYKEFMDNPERWQEAGLPFHEAGRTFLKLLDART
jgi:hypothetical protein